MWWYKYIGRSQEVYNPNNADVAAIFRECVASMSGATAYHYLRYTVSTTGKMNKTSFVSNPPFAVCCGEN